MLAEVDAAGATEDTVVVFLSDNGMAFPFAKSNCYLHSTRTPLVVRWPGVVAAGSVEAERFVEGIDLAPTILEVLGLPADPGADGRSFAPLFRGEAQAGRDQVVTVFHETVYGRRYEMRAIQDAGHGYIWNEWSDGEAAYLADNMMGRTWRAMLHAAERRPRGRRSLRALPAPRPRGALRRRVGPRCPARPRRRPGERASASTRRRRALRTWMERVGDPLLGRYEAFLATRSERGGRGRWLTSTCGSGGPGAPVSPFLFGGLIEHLGRAIYEGVWDPSATPPGRMCRPPSGRSA